MNWATAEGYPSNSFAGEAIAAGLPLDSSVRQYMATLPHRFRSRYPDWAAERTITRAT